MDRSTKNRPRTERRRRKKSSLRCPKCGSARVVRIIYGLPPRPVPPIDRSKYVRGGCMFRRENALCDACGHQWRAGWPQGRAERSEN